MLELIVIVGILIIMLAVGVPMLSGYMRKYTVQKEMSQIYSDLMMERVKSVETGVPRGVVFNSPTSYTLFIFNDENRNLKFDGAKEESAAVVKNLSIALNGPPAGTVILFDGMGVPRGADWSVCTFNIYIDTPTRYNCVLVSAEKISKGIWNGSVCEPR